VLLRIETPGIDGPTGPREYGVSSSRSANVHTDTVGPEPGAMNCVLKDVLYSTEQNSTFTTMSCKGQETFTFIQLQRHFN